MRSLEVVIGRENRCEPNSVHHWGVVGHAPCHSRFMRSLILESYMAKVDHVSQFLGEFFRPPLGGRSNDNLGDYDAWNLTIVHLFYSNDRCPTLLDIKTNKYGLPNGPSWVKLEKNIVPLICFVLSLASHGHIQQSGVPLNFYDHFTWSRCKPPLQCDVDYYGPQIVAISNSTTYRL